MCRPCWAQTYAVYISRVLLGVCCLAVCGCGCAEGVPSQAGVKPRSAAQGRLFLERPQRSGRGGQGPSRSRGAAGGEASAVAGAGRGCEGGDTAGEAAGPRGLGQAGASRQVERRPRPLLAAPAPARVPAGCRGGRAGLTLTPEPKVPEAAPSPSVRGPRPRTRSPSPSAPSPRSRVPPSPASPPGLGAIWAFRAGPAVA